MLLLGWSAKCGLKCALGVRTLRTGCLAVHPAIIELSAVAGLFVAAD